MASFTITADGTSAGVALAAAATAALMGGVFGGATVVLEASKDGTVYAPVLFQASCPGVSPVTIPIGWYVRTVTKGAGSTTSIKVEVA